MRKHSARIARSGIQYYLDSELAALKVGGIPREYAGQRVFSVYRPSFVLEEAKDRFAGAPVRIEHKWVYEDDDPEIIGHIDNDIRIKHNKGEVALCASLDMKDGTLPFGELSPGYTAVNRWQPGTTPGGESYEILCTSIKSVNHLAVVREARGGDDMKILDGGQKMKIHSGLIHFIKKRLGGVMDSAEGSFGAVVDELAGGIKGMGDDDISARTKSLMEMCRDLPDSEEKNKLLRYIADIPLLKGEDDAVAGEALSCIKESYQSLDSDAVSENMEKGMLQKEEEKKDGIKENSVSETEKAVTGGAADGGKAESGAAEKTADSDATEKLLEALAKFSEKLDALMAKTEPDAKPEGKETKEEIVSKEEEKTAVEDSLPAYTATLGTIEKGYSLEDAFAKLKGIK